MRTHFFVSFASLALLFLPVAVLLSRPSDRTEYHAVVEKQPRKQAPSADEKADSSKKGPAKFKDKSLQAWLEQLRNGKPKERAAAARMLAENLEPKDTAAISPLIVALKDKDELVRSYAVKGLGRFGPLDKEAIPALIEVAGEKYKSKYGMDVAETLGKIGPVAIPAMLAALEHKDAKVRQHVAEGLGKMGRSARSALPALAEALQDKDKGVRAAAAYAMAAIGPAAEHVAPLLRALADEDSIVRFAAARALGRIGPAARKAGPALVKALDDKEVAYPAAEALARIGPPREAIPAFIRLLKKDDAANKGRLLYAEGERREAANALGKIGPAAAAAVPALIERLQDKTETGPGLFSPNIRGAAARALGKIGATDKRVLPALIKGLDDEATLGDAAAALGDLGPAAAEALPALLKKSKELAAKPTVKSPEDFWAADGIIKALSGIGGPGILYLGELCQSRHGIMSDGVPQALEKLGPRAHAAVPGLIKAMKKKTTAKKGQKVNQKASIAVILARIGPKAKDAVPVLLEVAKDADLTTRQAAAYALYQIDPQAARKAGVHEPPMSAHVFVNSSRSNFEEGLSTDSGPPIGGKVLLWINGDPVAFFEGGGQMFNVDRWLRRGKNEISVSGKHDNPVYVAVANHYAMLKFDLAGKRAFAGPGSDDLAEPLVWDADKVPEIPQREELSTRPEDRKRYEREIRALLASLREAIKAHDGDKAAKLLFRGQRTWGPAYGERGAELDKQVASLAKQLSDPKVQLLGAPSGRLIFGKRLVMGYVERTDKTRPVQNLITIKADGRRSGVDTFFFARIRGEWIIWNPPHDLQVTLSLKVK
jgi:HEAT repeat protein